MRKGFTLIELLAVIVILAIIALIAVPIVLNIINEARESSTLRSAEFYLDAVEQAIVRKQLNGKVDYNPSNCEIVNSVLFCDGEELLIDVNGNLPSSGTITLSDGKVAFYTLVIDKTTIVNGVIELKQDYIFVLGEQYKLKNNEVMNIIASQENIYDISLPGIGVERAPDDNLPRHFVVVLNDESEWYLRGELDSSSNTIKLLSKYNYFVDESNKGEMDTLGNVNEIQAFSKITNDDEYSCLYENDYIEPFINDVIKPKLLDSLKLNSLNVTSPAQYTLGGGDNIYENLEPSFWYKEDQISCYPYGSNNYSESNGVRVEIEIDKSYVDAILISQEYIFDKDLGVYYKYDKKIDFKKIKETNEKIIYLAVGSVSYEGFSVGSLFTEIQYRARPTNCFDYARNLGYPVITYNFEDYEYEGIDLSIDVDGIENEIFRGICGSGEIFADDPSIEDIVELTFLKNR